MRLVRCAVAWVALVTSFVAVAEERVVELGSTGGYVSMPLPADTQDVDLLEQLGGACRFGRTWGFDLTHKELWVNGGCSGRFRLTLRHVDQSSSSDSNVGAAVAAAAAIAGIAILANRERERQNEAQPSYPQPSYPTYPQPGYRPPPTYPQPPSYPTYGARMIRGAGNLCLDMRGSVQQGTPAIVYQCHGRGNQRFEWTAAGELRVGGMCLDIANSSYSDGAAVVAWPCNGGRNQKWYADGAMIRSRMHGKCLTVYGPARNEVPVAADNCRRGGNQLWYW